MPPRAGGSGMKIRKEDEETIKEQLSIWHQRWLEIGTKGGPSEQEIVTPTIHSIYDLRGFSRPLIIYVASPLSANILLGISLRASLGASLRDSLRASLDASLYTNLRTSLDASLDASLRDSLRTSLDASLDASLRASLRASLYTSLRDSLRTSLRDSLRDSENIKYEPTYFWGSQESHWIYFYLFFQEVMGIKYQQDAAKKLSIMKNLCSAGWVYFYKNICLVCARPVIRTAWQNKRLIFHNPAGPAMLFEDGWEIYALNGVRVSKEIVMTRAEDLDPRLILHEKNAEIRREIVRKIGAEGILYRLGGKQLDKWSLTLDGEEIHYELYKCEGIRPLLLKMLNPSLKVWVVEPIRENGSPYLDHPIVTCRDALKWRFKGKEFNPSQLT